MRPTDYLPLIAAALDEDLSAAGDVTSQAIFPGLETIELDLVCKADGVLAGEEVFEAVFRRVDQSASVRFLRHDGDLLGEGDRVAAVSGRALSIMTAERAAINFVGILSGIATAARKYVEASRGAIVVLDTRKTIPGFRELSKYAVRVGGASNHRMGLYDMVLIKDNHITGAGSITEAVRRVRERHGDRYRIEVECRTRTDVEEAIDCEIDTIMLDNMSPEEMAECTALADDAIHFEASGNITLSQIPDLVPSGIDSASVGSITHSVETLDFSLRAPGG